LPEFSKLIGSLNHRVGYQIVKLWKFCKV
jgi:hypothetical protein